MCRRPAAGALACPFSYGSVRWMRACVASRHRRPAARNAPWLRLEDRWFGGRIGDQAEFGLAAFADAGRVWAGDLPAGLGVTTPIEVGTGVALLVAFPPGSQRVWRLEAAVPASAGQRGRFQIRFGNVRVFQLNSPEPPDVRAGREQAVPRTAFNFP